jgi:hypothetical protein
MKLAPASPLLGGGGAQATKVVGDELKVPKVNGFAKAESTAIADEGTIGTSRGKTCYISPLLVHQLSVFCAPARSTVVKIASSYSEMVLQTLKNYKAHYSLS